MHTYLHVTLSNMKLIFLYKPKLAKMLCFDSLWLRKKERHYIFGAETWNSFMRGRLISRRCESTFIGEKLIYVGVHIEHQVSFATLGQRILKLGFGIGYRPNAKGVFPYRLADHNHWIQAIPLCPADMPE